MNLLYSDIGKGVNGNINKRLKPKVNPQSAPSLPPSEPKPKWWETLIEQVVNSIIIGGIAGLSALIADPSVSWKVGLIAFGITALTELRKYRKLY